MAPPLDGYRSSEAMTDDFEARFHFELGEFIFVSIILQFTVISFQIEVYFASASSFRYQARYVQGTSDLKFDS